MVVSKVEFNAAMKEINESYAKQNARIEELEKLVADMKEQEKAVKPTRKAATNDE